MGDDGMVNHGADIILFANISREKGGLAALR
jgi:hypothetical protein